VNRPLLILGLETSCDETAGAVTAEGGLVLSNVIASQHDLHGEYGGVVPEIASRAHAERILPVVHKALAEAGATFRDIGAVAVGSRPGLIGALLVGVSAAKALAWSLGVPLIGVDHVEAHLYAPLLQRRSDAATNQRSAGANVYPALGLVVSGGHTAVYLLRSPIDIARLGATIDDAVGEAYDKVGAVLGLPYPGGPHVDRLARLGNPRAHDFPISRLAPDSLDFSFSGLKTAVLYAVRGVPGAGEKGKMNMESSEGAHAPKLTAPIWSRDAARMSEAEKADVAASFQRVAVQALMLKLGRALDMLEASAGGGAQERGKERPRSLLVGGGVSANSLLRTELAAFAAMRGLELRLPAMEFCLDNAAMIAGLGAVRLAAGLVDDLSLRAEPTTG